MYIEETKKIDGIPVTMIGYPVGGECAEILDIKPDSYRFEFLINNGRIKLEEGFNVKAPLVVDDKYVSPVYRPHLQRTDVELLPAKMMIKFEKIKDLNGLVSLLEEFQGKPLPKAHSSIAALC